jgi:hypothetical protein
MRRGESSLSHSFFDEVEDSLSSPASRSVKPKHWCALLIIFLLIGMWLPAFDYHRHLLPEPDVAAHSCKTLVLKSEHSLVEAALVVTDLQPLPVRLYATTLVRDATCKGQDNIALNLSYRDVYLNVSLLDVESELEKLRARFPAGKTYQAWFYDLQQYKNLLEPEDALDRYGLAERPLEIYRDYRHAQIQAKLELCASAILLTLLIYFLVFFAQTLYARRRR